MSGRRITVLYEDQLAARPNNYGPHVLMLACVADRMGGDTWMLGKRVLAIAKKGDSKLRAALREEGAMLADGGPVVAMFDADRVRACYGLPSNACKQSVLDAIEAEASGVPVIVLLERNMEDVVAACCAASNKPFPQSKPTPQQRDAILHGAASAGAAVRVQVLASVPSFERLVRAVHGLLEIADASKP